MIKDSLRRLWLARRLRRGSVMCRDCSRNISRLVSAIPDIRKARCLMVYLPIQGEVDTWPLIRSLVSAGKRLCVPRTYSGMKKIEPWCISGRQSDCSQGPYGILEPLPELSKRETIHKIDVVLVPGIVFNFKGFRIGFGKGYYDRFLRRLGKRSLRVGLAFEQQMVRASFEEPHDVRLDAVVTERRVLLLSGKAQKNLKLLT